MNPVDIDVLRKRHREIITEAELFGYNLSLGGWEYDQTVCPLLLGKIILHYRRLSRGKATSEFTAIVPQGSGRVYVIPVLYRNATPFHSAPGSTRSIYVFNQLIPAARVAAALQPEGQWLPLAACYADISGAEGNVMEHVGDSVALAQAPDPTLRISENRNLRQVSFTERDAPHHYTVWQLTFNSEGRLTVAVTSRLADYVAHSPSPQGNRTTVVPARQKHPAKIVPLGTVPNVGTIPH